MRSCSSQRHEVNIGTPEEENHGKFNGTSCQNSLVFMAECTSAQALSVVHNTALPALGGCSHGKRCAETATRFLHHPALPSKTPPAKRWWHPGIFFDSIWLAQRRPNPPSTMSRLMSFTCTVPRSVPEHEPRMLTHHLVQDPVKGP